MDDYNPQPILLKRWGKKKEDGVIRVKTVIGKNKASDKKEKRYFAFLYFHLLGKIYKTYLGESDNLGRPLLSRL